MDRLVKAKMCGHSMTTRADLITAIKEVIQVMSSPAMAQKRRNFISHVPIAMLECIAARGAEPFKYHVRPHVNEKQI